MLTAERKNEIEMVVNQVLAKYNITKCPAKELMRIMQNEQIHFYKKPVEDINFDGLLTKNINDEFCIYINTRIDYSPRHNFTIAHELGHYFLRHELQNGSLICDRCSISEDITDNNDIEQEANYFAASLLMPKEMFLNSYEIIMKKLDRYRYKRLYVDNQQCNYKDWLTAVQYFYYDFRISIIALRYRLESLGLAEFNWDENFWEKSIDDYVN